MECPGALETSDALIDSSSLVLQLDGRHLWSMPEQLQERRDVDQPKGIAILAV